MLRGFDPRLDPKLLVRRLHDEGVDLARLNLLRAASAVWSRHNPEEPIANPIAFLAKAIARECSNPDWAITRPGHRPPSSGAFTATNVCAVNGHKWIGLFREYCATCAAERPNWRDDRDRLEQPQKAPRTAEGANVR